MNMPFIPSGAGLANGDRVDDRGAKLAELTFLGTPYAAVKGHWTSRSPCGVSLASTEKDREFLAGENRLLLQDEPLKEPPEIRRIQRGAVSHFVGNFINDGIVSWWAVDLDRLNIIAIKRSVFDTRCGFTRRFGDPIISEYFPGFARKWSSEQRVEIEVVQENKLRCDEAGAFLCIANAIWAASPQKAERPQTTDTAIRELYLLDRAFEEAKSFGTLRFAGETYLYRRDVTNHGAFDWLLGALVRGMATCEWTKPQSE